DIFYLFVSMGWFFNAIYLVSDLFFDKEKLELDFGHAIAVYWLSMASTFAFWIAVLIPSGRPSLLPRKRSLYIWLPLFFMSVMFNIYSLVNYVPPDTSSVPTNEVEAALSQAIRTPFFWNSIVGMVFTAYVLYKLGRGINDRLAQTRDSTLWWLPLSFYLYGLLQPLYSIKYFLGKYV